MTIGNAPYQCSCVRYVAQHNIPLIVGLSVGLGLLLIIIIIIVVVLYCRRQSKQSGQGRAPGPNDGTSMEQVYEEMQDNRQLPENYYDRLRYQRYEEMPDNPQLPSNYYDRVEDQQDQYSRQLPFTNDDN